MLDVADDARSQWTMLLGYEVLPPVGYLFVVYEYEEEVEHDHHGVDDVHE